MTVINLGNIKFTWKGVWASATEYKKDDIVKYGPSTYVCIDAHTSTSAFIDNKPKFDLMTEGLAYGGVWNQATLYQVYDIVNYGGAVYIALQENINTIPATQPSYWSKLVGGLEFEGDYNNGTQYQDGDIVRYGGYTYTATTDTLGNLPTDTNYWEILNRGYIFKGSWNNAIEYLPGELVELGGKVYSAKATNTNDAPPSSNWDLFVSGSNYRNSWNNISTYRPGDIVRYGGNSYITIQTSLGNRPVNPTYFSLYHEGFNFRGDYQTSADYNPGDVVKYGGRSYICTVDAIYVSPTEILPTDTNYWSILNKGLDWKGNWDSNSIDYKLDDVVEYSGSSYVCITAHTSSGAPAPNTDTGRWQSLAQGDISSPMTTEGDMIYRNGVGATVRLPIGPSGSFLTVKGGVPSWGHLTPQNDYFVSPQGDNSNDGRTPTTSWKTIQHAAQQTFSLGQCRINISSGTYEEQCPIRVGRGVVIEGNGLGAVTISPNTTRDDGYGVGISNDGSTPNANSEVFQMNNGARLRNFVFRNFSTGSVQVALDPGYGPDDTSVWITSQSPYVQNCTNFSPGGTGFKIDGALHNGGYKSMVANDFTQINSDGVGIHALNDGRTEIVSCFTYYCDIGYLAEGGAKIRAIVGNNSYGEYGAVARGFSQSETPLTANLELTDQTINSVTQLGSNVHIFTSYRDSVGNRIFVGHTDPTGTDVTSSWDNTASYPFIAKFNSVGSLDWIYTYESSFGAIHSVVELSDRYYAGGVIYDAATNKGFILSISKAGEIQWQKTIGDTSEIVDVTTDDNNLYAVGTHTTTGSSVVKLNPAGVEQWSKTLEYNDSSAANTLVATSACVAKTPTTSTDTYALAGDATAEGNLYVASYDSTSNQSLVTRITSTGTYVATYQYGDVRINSLRLDTGNGDGIYLIAGGYYDAGAVNKNPLIFRLTVTGAVAWQKQIALNTEEGEFKDVLPFGDDIYAVGYLNEGTNNNNTGFITRYSSNETISWIQKFDNGTNNIAFNGVMLDGVNVIAAGIEQGNSVITNIQRDTAGGIGTVSSGSYVLGALTVTETDNTVVARQFNEIDLLTVTLGNTDTTLTLNQSPTQTRTVTATRDGFAGIGTGALFSISGLSRSPKEGSVLQIAGDTETYFVIGVNNFLEGAGSTGTCQVTIDPRLPSNKTPNDGTSVVFREAFSQVRMSGHDFLDIGTGGFADTNYPVIIDADYTQQPNQERETLSENGGRVFYVTTDQDGNFRVGDYFKVEQATGRATLSSEEFDLAGLNELQLGSITAGKQGATINEFSTDGTFADNSDSAVPTEKAVKTYVDQEISILSASQGTIVGGSAPTQSKVEVTGTGLSTDTIDFDIAGTEVARIGDEYMLIPAGTTANRPSAPANGYIRYNTTINAFEGYVNGAWSGLGGGNPWVTKTDADTGYTALNNDRILVDTSAGVTTINLPASPNVGDNVRFLDKSGTFDGYALTVDPGAENINGVNDTLVVSQENAGFQLLYVGASQGWKLLEL